MSSTHTVVMYTILVIFQMSDLLKLPFSLGAMMLSFTVHLSSFGHLPLSCSSPAEGTPETFSQLPSSTGDLLLIRLLHGQLPGTHSHTHSHTHTYTHIHSTVYIYFSFSTTPSYTHHFCLHTHTDTHTHTHTRLTPLLLSAVEEWAGVDRKSVV